MYKDRANERRRFLCDKQQVAVCDRCYVKFSKGKCGINGEDSELYAGSTESFNILDLVIFSKNNSSIRCGRNSAYTP